MFNTDTLEEFVQVTPAVIVGTLKNSSREQQVTETLSAIFECILQVSSNSVETNNELFSVIQGTLEDFEPHTYAFCQFTYWNTHGRLIIDRTKWAKVKLVIVRDHSPHKQGFINSQTIDNGQDLQSCKMVLATFVPSTTAVKITECPPNTRPTGITKTDDYDIISSNIYTTRPSTGYSLSPVLYQDTSLYLELTGIVTTCLLGVASASQLHAYAEMAHDVLKKTYDIHSDYSASGVVYVFRTTEDYGNKQLIFSYNKDGMEVGWCLSSRDYHAGPTPNVSDFADLFRRPSDMKSS